MLIMRQSRNNLGGTASINVRNTLAEEAANVIVGNGGEKKKNSGAGETNVDIEDDETGGA